MGIRELAESQLAKSQHAQWTNSPNPNMEKREGKVPHRVRCVGLVRLG